MRKLTLHQVAQIKACVGVYPQADVAKQFGIDRSMVNFIYKGHSWKNVSPAAEPPNVIAKTRAAVLREDISILLNRGMTVKEVAATLGLSYKTVYAYKRRGER